MASDNYYDGFDYQSSQDYLDIEYQIDLFEIRHQSKAKRHNRQNMNKPSYSISSKTIKSQSARFRDYCTHDKKLSKLQHKKSRSRKTPNFTCDRFFKNKSKPSMHTNSPSDFNTFRRHFYHTNHQQIKSSLKTRADIKINNIRLAPIDKFVQDDFMKRFHQDKKCYPRLVYHGTNLDNIQSILHYGFLIPNKPHPTNKEAPIIPMANGNSYGTGIYSSETANFSISYGLTTNTLLVCAALPKCDNTGHPERSHGNILVLSHVSEIIPLFLMDFTYLNGSGVNKPLFIASDNVKINKREKNDKFTIIPKNYLRKIINYVNDQVRKNTNNQYQIRMFDPFI